MWRLVILAAFLLPPQAHAQVRNRRELPPACTSACVETCRSEVESGGCNPAVGLTACRLREDQCVAACARKCPRS